MLIKRLLIQKAKCSIVADKGSNSFDECAAQCVHLCPQEEECTSSSWGDSKCTYFAPQQIHRRADKNGAVAPLRNSVVPPSKNFNGTRDSIRHLKISRVVSNEMPVLLLILCWCYFSCLQIYSEKFFNVFYEQIFFEIFVEKGDTGQFFEK